MIMSASGFPSLALGCFLLALAVAPHVVHGSSRGLTPGGGAVAPPASAAGLCASGITIHGYQCQEFDVVTKDGYILSVQRIPEGRAGGGSTNKQPVFIQHGVLADGSAWLVNSPEQNLPLILADNGFDVWIANGRGTQFSRRHTSLSPANPEFWDWSWDELAAFDLPAVFDLIHGKTGKKVHYVGHSLGTTIALASLSEGKLVDKLQSVALLSPVAYLTHVTTALGIVAARSFLGEVGSLIGLAEFNPVSKPVTDFLEALCARPGLDCYDFLTAFTGPNCCLNVSTADLFLTNYPQSTSMKNLVHLSQTVRDGGLTKYNYEIPSTNMMHYGDASPPVYNLSNIPHDVPMFLSYGGLDSLADPKDVQLLLDSLKLHDVEKLTVQFVKDYAHMDFLMGVNAKDIVYTQVLSFFKNQH
ncbi:hypothetical protein BT93_C1375 [Corymbia citriodora subsp. variegata]|nr:hypothetical protein BT93_C1375 [Corymbia citriodora subsp. variegata]